jgi:hypothetical protein
LEEKMEKIMDSERQAALWKHNWDVVRDWALDYGRRMGKTLDEVMSERVAGWGHEESAKMVGIIDGYALTACQLTSGEFRYTVVTPNRMNEGLCDLDERDDARAERILRDVIARLTPASVSETKSEPRTPVRRSVVQKAEKTPRNRAEGVPERTFQTHEVNGVPQLALF